MVYRYPSMLYEGPVKWQDCLFGEVGVQTLQLAGSMVVSTRALLYIDPGGPSRLNAHHLHHERDPHLGGLEHSASLTADIDHHIQWTHKD